MCVLLTFLHMLTSYEVHVTRTVTVSLRTFARNFSNIDFFLKILPVKVDELVMSEM